MTRIEFKFEDLKVYQLSLEFIKHVNVLISKFP